MTKGAWVTLATNDSYGLGALVLAHSLRRVGSTYPCAVLITPSVTDSMRERLRTVFAEVVQVDVLDSKDTAHLALLRRPELGITFTKLHCWNLTNYEKCVFLDADTLVMQNCDELFDREEFSAAPDVGWPDCFNSGVFVYSPSNDTFEKLIAFANDHGSFDGGDQGLLNSFFANWARGDISKHLPFIYNVTSAAFYSYLPALQHYGGDAKIVHFIGTAKPWLTSYDWNSGSVDAPFHLQSMLQLWWDIFVRNVHPQLDSTMSGVAGNLARVALGSINRDGNNALTELTRRQGWETGNIDYMGADSFENIWAKISDTLNKPRMSPPKVIEEETTKNADFKSKESLSSDHPEESKDLSKTEVSQQLQDESELKPFVEITDDLKNLSATQLEVKLNDKEEQQNVHEYKIPPNQVLLSKDILMNIPEPVLELEQTESKCTTQEEISTLPELLPADSKPDDNTKQNSDTQEKSCKKRTQITEEALKQDDSQRLVLDNTPTDSFTIDNTDDSLPTSCHVSNIDIPEPKDIISKDFDRQFQPAAKVEKLDDENIQSVLSLTADLETKMAISSEVDEPGNVSKVSDFSTNSPPLANTPVKDATTPEVTAEERRKPVSKLQLCPPLYMDTALTPDSDFEDAATLAQSIIASELKTPTVTSPSPPTCHTTPPFPRQEKRLSVDETIVSTPPASVSLAQIGVKPAKSKTTVAEQIQSSILSDVTVDLTSMVETEDIPGSVFKLDLEATPFAASEVASGSVSYPTLDEILKTESKVTPSEPTLASKVTPEAVSSALLEDILITKPSLTSDSSSAVVLGVVLKETSKADSTEMSKEESELSLSTSKPKSVTISVADSETAKVAVSPVTSTRMSEEKSDISSPRFALTSSSVESTSAIPSIDVPEKTSTTPGSSPETSFKKSIKKQSSAAPVPPPRKKDKKSNIK